MHDKAATSKNRRQLVPLSVAAQQLGVAPRTVRRMITDGRLTGYRVGARLLRVDLNEIDRAITTIPTAS